MKSLPLFALLSLLALGACGGSSNNTTPPPPQSCSPQAPTSAVAPPSLADWCQVSIQNGDVALKSGVLPYDLTTPLFSDNALKRRTMWLPPGTSASYASDDVFSFPDGTVFTKSFGFRDDLRKPNPVVTWIETRVEWKVAGQWYALSYTWNVGATEAVANPAGDVRNISFIDETGASVTAHYLVPSQSQCGQCHQQNTYVTLGTRARYLNKDYPYSTGTANQLTHLTAMGWLTGAPADPANAPRLPVASDPTSGTVGERARAYLDANCGFCHNPVGSARTTGLTLWASESDPFHYGVCKVPVAAGGGSGGLQYDVVPGEPDQSIIPYRMNSNVPAVAMPQIGRSVVDHAGLQLVRDWITGLSGTCP